MTKRPPPLTPPEEVKAIRKALGLYQEELAAAVGVRKNTVWTWESGHRAVPEPVLYLLREYLHRRKATPRPQPRNLRAYLDTPPNGRTE
jgi:transcriptional regulator with XRE-family HTH domain